MLPSHRIHQNFIIKLYIYLKNLKEKLFIELLIVTRVDNCMTWNDLICDLDFFVISVVLSKRLRCNYTFEETKLTS